MEIPARLSHLRSLENLPFPAGILLPSARDLFPKGSSTSGYLEGFGKDLNPEKIPSTQRKPSLFLALLSKCFPIKICSCQEKFGSGNIPLLRAFHSHLPWEFPEWEQLFWGLKPQPGLARSCHKPGFCPWWAVNPRKRLQLQFQRRPSCFSWEKEAFPFIPCLFLTPSFEMIFGLFQ